jgi:hypothetical protein
LGECNIGGELEVAVGKEVGRKANGGCHGKLRWGVGGRKRGEENKSEYPISNSQYPIMKDGFRTGENGAALRIGFWTGESIPPHPSLKGHPPPRGRVKKKQKKKQKKKKKKK